jgi:hypothetical protein
LKLPERTRAAGENFRCTVVRRGETLLGFVTGVTWISHFAGLVRLSINLSRYLN